MFAIMEEGLIGGGQRQATLHFDGNVALDVDGVSGGREFERMPDDVPPVAVDQNGRAGSGGEADESMVRGRMYDMIEFYFDIAHYTTQ
jgi:hypothetical protein